MADNQIPVQFRPQLPTGGSVEAIVPRSFDDIQRVANTIVAAGLTPASLGRKKTPEEQLAGVTIVLMTGLELGLKPMAALRSLTVIGNKPAAYGDGAIAVVRMSGRAKAIKMGCDERDGILVGWCDATRSDTGESDRVEFSQLDAQEAGLWDTRPTVSRWNNFNKTHETVPNDAPWFRYKKRMLMWRAAGYCLRNLFADVLFGLVDEFEAAESAGYVDVDVPPTGTPIAGAPAMPPLPPPPPDIVDVPVDGDEAPSESATEFLQSLDDAMATAADEATLEQIWADHDVEQTLADEDHLFGLAKTAKERHQARLSAPAGNHTADAADGHSAPSEGEGAGNNTSPVIDHENSERLASSQAAAKAADGPPPPPAADNFETPADEAGALKIFARRLVVAIGDSAAYVTTEARALGNELTLGDGLVRDKARSITAYARRACADYGKPDALSVANALAMIAGVAGVDDTELVAAMKGNRA